MLASAPGPRAPVHAPDHLTPAALVQNPHEDRGMYAEAPVQEGDEHWDALACDSDD